MLNFIFNLSAPVFTLIFALYAALVVYVLVSIAKSEYPLGTKIILLVVMIVVPLSPIFYLLMNSPNKAVGKTK
jgi:hypothetical protein